MHRWFGPRNIIELKLLDIGNGTPNAAAVAAAAAAARCQFIIGEGIVEWSNGLILTGVDDDGNGTGGVAVVLRSSVPGCVEFSCTRPSDLDSWFGFFTFDHSPGKNAAAVVGKYQGLGLFIAFSSSLCVWMICCWSCGMETKFRPQCGYSHTMFELRVSFNVCFEFLSSRLFRSDSDSVQKGQ